MEKTEKEKKKEKKLMDMDNTVRIAGGREVGGVEGGYWGDKW